MWKMLKSQHKHGKGMATMSSNNLSLDLYGLLKRVKENRFLLPAAPKKVTTPIIVLFTWNFSSQRKYLKREKMQLKFTLLDATRRYPTLHDATRRYTTLRSNIPSPFGYKNLFIIALLSSFKYLNLSSAVFKSNFSFLSREVF
jgi:hypothetical protein